MTTPLLYHTLTAMQYGSSRRSTRECHNVNNTNPAWRSVEYMHAESLTHMKTEPDHYCATNGFNLQLILSVRRKINGCKNNTISLVWNKTCWLCLAVLHTYSRAVQVVQNCGLWLSYWREVIPIFLMAASCSGVKGNTGLEAALSAAWIHFHERI